MYIAPVAGLRLHDLDPDAVPVAQLSSVANSMADGHEGASSTSSISERSSGGKFQISNTMPLSFSTVEERSRISDLEAGRGLI
jgi:hypothetical protein